MYPFDFSGLYFYGTGEKFQLQVSVVQGSIKLSARWRNFLSEVKRGALLLRSYYHFAGLHLSRTVISQDIPYFGGTTFA